MTRIRDAFWENADTAGNCWLWRRSVNDHGYGKLMVEGGRLEMAHRFAYELYYQRPIDSGMTIDHLCRTPGCVNPLHLEMVTQQVNILRSTGPSARCATMTHCKWGHPFDAANTYIGPKNKRHCRACRARRLRELRARRETTAHELGHREHVA